MKCLRSKKNDKLPGLYYFFARIYIYIYTCICEYLLTNMYGQNTGGDGGEHAVVDDSRMVGQEAPLGSGYYQRHGGGAGGHYASGGLCRLHWGLFYRVTPTLNLQH